MNEETSNNLPGLSNNAQTLPESPPEALETPKRRLRPMTNRTDVIGGENQTGQARAVLTRRNRNMNPTGKNQWTFEKSLTPYSVRYALAHVMLKQGKTIRVTAQMSGLCVQTVVRIKKGEIKLANEWIEEVKKCESAKHTFLANMILDSIDSQDIAKASLLQKVTSSSILIDKRRLIDGQSTVNVNHLASLDQLTALGERSKANLDRISSIEAEVIDNQPQESDTPPLVSHHNQHYQ
jgi:hypothetical protein